MRCSECAGGRRVLRATGVGATAEPLATYVLMAVNVGFFLVTNRVGGGLGFSTADITTLGREMVLDGPDVANGDYYRLISSAFMHFGLLHIAFNMYALYLIGGALERYIGSLRFTLIYFVSALAGSFGALLVTPNAISAGASGAIFGLMGAMFVLERQRGLALLGGPIGGLIAINLLITFLPGTDISIGGHLGGLVGGALAGFVLSGYGRGHMAHGRLGLAPALGLAAIAAVSVVGALAVAG
jgi:membrane associated rhomboid family serine protease